MHTQIHLDQWPRQGYQQLALQSLQKTLGVAIGLHVGCHLWQRFTQQHGLSVADCQAAALSSLSPRWGLYWRAGNWGQQTGDRELGTGNWGQGTGGNWGNWRQGTGLISNYCMHKSPIKAYRWISDEADLQLCRTSMHRLFFQGTPTSSIRVAQKSS